MQRDTKVEHEIRGHIIVRLPAPGAENVGGIHGCIGRTGVEILGSVLAGKIVGGVRRGRRAAAIGYVRMLRHFRGGEGVGGLAAGLSQVNPVSDMEWNATLEIRQREVCPPVSTVSGAQDRKERLILIDGQQGAIAHRPALGRESERENFYFTKKWFRHWFEISCETLFLKICRALTFERGRSQTEQ